MSLDRLSNDDDERRDFLVKKIFQKKFICQLIERFEVQLMIISDCFENERVKIVV
jgi:hypothetical protein